MSSGAKETPPQALAVAGSTSFNTIQETLPVGRL